MSESTRNTSCEGRIEDHLEGRLEDIRSLWRAYQTGEEDPEELGDPGQYGLAFDFVPAGTFSDQRQGYFRWQLSWGGPSDEFRFYADPYLHCHRIEYWFLDWFDGASRVLSGEDEALMLELWDWFREVRVVSSDLEEV